MYQKITLILLCILSLGCFAEENSSEEEIIAAVSSLRCHISQLITPEINELIIPFDKEDIKQLWSLALQSKHADFVDRAKKLYDLATEDEQMHLELLEEANEHLYALWDDLTNYPNFKDNPYLDQSMQILMAPYLLPTTHPAKPILDVIFSQSRAIANKETFANAGFITLHAQPSSYIRVAKHPAIPGYLLKVYLDTIVELKRGRVGWQWLTDRCIGAENIKKLIKKKKLQFFTVADKWIYPLPPEPKPQEPAQPIVLLVRDMNLVSYHDSVSAWKNASHALINELYCVLSHGYGSYFLPGNIPLTKSGKFAFVDTEYPKRKISMHNVKRFLSTEMKGYWDQLVKSGGKKKKTIEPVTPDCVSFKDR